jgi:hypothetical protein
LGGAVIEGSTPAQRDALAKVARVVDASTYLAGGVAIALRLRHRQSRDLDLFTTADPEARIDALADPALGARILSRSGGTVHLEISGVPVSWLRYRYPLLAPLERIAGITIPLASLEDAMAMKLSAIAGRGAARDFWDLRAILLHQGLSLSDGLRAFERKYAAEDIGHVVKSLSYFVDAEKDPFPAGLSREQWHAIRADFESWVRAL